MIKSLRWPGTRKFSLESDGVRYMMSLGFACFEGEALALNFLNDQENWEYKGYAPRRRHSYLMGKLTANLALSVEEQDLRPAVSDYRKPKRERDALRSYRGGASF